MPMRVRVGSKVNHSNGPCKVGNGTGASRNIGQYRLTQYHHMTYHISMENIFNTRLNLLPIDKLVTIRQLRFLMKIANLPTTRLTRQIINSFAIPKAGTVLAKGRYLSTRSSLRETLEKVEIVTSGSGGPLKIWIPFLQRNDIGNYIEQKLELPEGTFSKPKKKKLNDRQ